MKNKLKIKIFIVLFFFNIIQNKANTDEIIFNTKNLDIVNNGNTIKAGLGHILSNKDNIKIKAESFNYDKISSLIKADKAFVELKDKKINIKADKIIYNSKLSTINAIGNVQITKLENKAIIKSDNIFYQKEKEIISSIVKSVLIDRHGNNITSDSFIFTLINNEIKITNAQIKDINNNVYYLEKGFVNLTTDQLTGKDVSIDFANDYFNANNQPRLKGRALSHNNNETIIEKGIFTTCKKNDDCPPWQFLAKEIVHDKKKKTINYKNALLKIYDVPVFYFPKFFHPDPTVKRQSGFLAPTFINSSNQSSVFTLPYYHAISDSKDLTLSPRFYSTNKFLTQLEYRSVYAKSKHIIDFSTLNQKNENSKNHFFSESSGEINLDNFEKSEISLQLQSTSNDTYLKSYKLDSPIINDTDTLVSSFNFSAYRSDLAIESYLTVYEDLSESKKSDKYEYVYPAFNITKELYTSLNSFGDLNLNSNGYMKNHNTNIFEKVLVNDLLFSSYPSFNKSGLKNNFNILFKNTNTDSKNSKKYKNNLNTKLSTLFEYNSSYPLQKKGDNYTNIIKPIISLRYSPNNSKNMRDEERRIDANNIFSLNRISSNESVEGGGSFSFGTEFNKNDELNNEIFSGKIANVFRFEEDKNLPTSSSLGKKTSDIVGSINYNPNKYFSINYEFSEDESLKNTNYQLLKNEFKVNNFISTFEYLNENNTIKNESYLSNKTVFKLSNSTSLGFEARENKKTRATEFYNLIYEYRNDCLIAAIQYNKDYYIDRDYKPSENVFLMLTIIPFGETKSPNIK